MRIIKLLVTSMLVLLVHNQMLSQANYKYGNTYKIKVPDFMSKMNLGSEDASMQYGNIYKELYFIVIDESKTEFVDIFTELDIYDSYESPLNNYREVQVEMIKEGMINPNASRPVIFDANGKTGQIVELSGKFEDIDVFYVFGFVQGENKLYMVMAWTLKEKKYKYKTELINLVKSFREI